MSLRSKIFLILATVVVSYAAIDNGILRIFTRKIFGSWERQEAREDLTRVHQRIDTEIQDLAGKARVHAGLKALQEFVAAPDAEFVRANLGSDALERAGIDLFYVCDADGKVLWGSILDPETREPMRLAEFPRDALSPNNAAINFHADEDRITGLVITKSYPLLLCSVPIPGADGVLLQERGGSFFAPAHGALILGRFLGPELEARIVREELDLTQDRDGAGAPADIELLELGEERLPASVLDPERTEAFEEGQDDLLHAYEKIDSLRTGEPLVLHVSLDRTIAARKRDWDNYALLSTLAGGLLVLFVQLRLLQSIVIRPLSTLTNKAVEIGRRDDTTIRVNLVRNDEIGQLGGEFDRMLGKLAKSREQVIETARHAGMSEIATGVLHNVGNVLNSVNVSANLASRKVEDLALRDLEMLVSVLQKHENDLATFVGQDPRGKHLVPFLNELVRSLGGQKQAVQEELRALNQGIEHIAELVRAQQSFAGTKGVFEHTLLAESVEAALSICGQALDANPDIQVVRQFEDVPAVRVDRHKLMEILVNVIQNARQALDEHGGGDQRITVKVSRPDSRTARIEVSDNGVGIPEGNLTRIFQHGFTTKKNGHGFGLHMSANAATEMGSKLHARSDGSGTGATFWLDFPIEEEPARVAA